MTYYGKVKNGVIVVEDAALPEGADVTIETAVPGPATPPFPDLPKTASFADRMLALAKWSESFPCSLPRDLAENLDHYLHGHPKRS